MTAWAAHATESETAAGAWRTARTTYTLGVALLLAAQAADLLTTWLALSVSGSQAGELNPLLRLVMGEWGIAGVAVLKLLVALGLLRLARYLHDRAGWQVAIRMLRPANAVTLSFALANVLQTYFFLAR